MIDQSHHQTAKAAYEAARKAGHSAHYRGTEARNAAIDFMIEYHKAAARYWRNVAGRDHARARLAHAHPRRVTPRPMADAARQEAQENAAAAYNWSEWTDHKAATMHRHAAISTVESLARTTAHHAHLARAAAESITIGPKQARQPSAGGRRRRSLLAQLSEAERCRARDAWIECDRAARAALARMADMEIIALRQATRSNVLSCEEMAAHAASYMYLAQMAASTAAQEAAAAIAEEAARQAATLAQAAQEAGRDAAISTQAALLAVWNEETADLARQARQAQEAAAAAYETIHSSQKEAA